MTQKGYRFLEGLTCADYAFEATGKDLNELFTNAGLALCSSMADLEFIAPKEIREIKFSSDELDQLLFDFLEEIIFLKDAECLLIKDIEIKVTKGKRYCVKGVIKGEEINSKKHKLLADVKSVTYHLFKVEKNPSGWRAQVILDV